MECFILGRTTEAREEVPEEGAEVCSVSIVVLWAMQELGGELEMRVLVARLGVLEEGCCGG